MEESHRDRAALCLPRLRHQAQATHRTPDVSKPRTSKRFDIIYTATRGGPIDATMNLYAQSYFTGARALNVGDSMAFLVVFWILCYGLAFFLLRARRGRLA